MGSLPPPQLSLDLRPTFVPKTITDFLYEVSTIAHASDKLSRLDDFVNRLEEEMRKIDAFRRELPLCMLLLNDAILVLKEESAKFRIPDSQPVLEEFIPLRKQCDQKEEDETEKECRDKKNWMSSVQLWNTDSYPTCEQKERYKLENKKNEEPTVAEDPLKSCRNRIGRRVFMPFASYSPVHVTTVATKEEMEESDINGLSLVTPGVKNLREGSVSSGSRISSGRAVSSPPCSDQPSLRTGQHQTARKQRRCWSPELHRRFVNALQQLGGSQAATPKQIRELMQVDGLTNDEVKSHLQKYRLHTRRLPASTATPGDQSVVVLGSLWMSQDQYNDSSKGIVSGSGSPQGPLQLTSGSGGGMSQTEDDSMEDDDDEKSESDRWNGEIHKPGKNDV
ncbi:LOW QUALITY PROTEIN: transcription factor HHO6-like [Neltuma alba]|uniref:LOW QUALITY PROTEIN: transcription factor HHO6-like n=1 Tax=Neltuma alba TaxID=207710 RepID=UPI0010A55EF3|nr:LOW QUALITY PROTEIN: transcription factor HHO6-like [Prosopis alba]